MGKTRQGIDIERTGSTLPEIARARGCTRQNIDLILRRLLKKLKPIYLKYHLDEFLKGE